LDAHPGGFERFPGGSRSLWQGNPPLGTQVRQIYQIFEGTAQVQRLVVSRMQRREYQERLKEAAEVLEESAAAA
jgi:hypothetical protein